MATWTKDTIRQLQLRGSLVVSHPSSSAPAPKQPPARIKVPKPVVGDVGNQSGVTFSHPNRAVGTLTVETGLDTARWGYNLNTQVYPTYGGEVVQILSVYIDDLQIGGSLSTYSQMEAIYSYFAAYMQIATQGRTSTPDPGVSAYNQQPMTFAYPARGWEFEIMPMSAPGFYMATDVVLPAWQLSAHIVDDSINSNPTLTSIKTQITNQVVESGLENFAKLNDEISPDMKNPDTMPFMVFNGDTASSLSNYADYYNSLIASYSGNDPTNIPGSQPATAPSTNSGQGNTSGKAKTNQLIRSGH